MDLLDSLLFVDCGVVFVKSLLVLWSLVTVMSTTAFLLNTYLFDAPTWAPNLHTLGVY